jgi:hypothetical protein
MFDTVVWYVCQVLDLIPWLFVYLRRRGGAFDFLPIPRRRKDTKSILPNKHQTYVFSESSRTS